MGSPPHNSLKSLFNNLLHPTFQLTAIPVWHPCQNWKTGLKNLSCLGHLHTPSIPSDQLGASHFFSVVQYRLTSLHGARFLKVEVLPALAKSFEIEMVKRHRLSAVNDTEKVKKKKVPGMEFVWKVVDPDKVPPPPRFKRKKAVVGTEVGVNLDYGHLNKRRQNARVGKITRDVETMKLLKRTWRQEQTGKGSQTPEANVATK